MYAHCITFAYLHVKSYLKFCSIPWDFLLLFYLVLVPANRPSSYRPSCRDLANMCFAYPLLLAPSVKEHAHGIPVLGSLCDRLSFAKSALCQIPVCLLASSIRLKSRCLAVTFCPVS